MSLNWKEIDLILSELSFTQGKIQQIRQPEFHTLYLGIYASHQLQHLYFYLAQNTVRMHTEKHASKKPKHPPRFQQLLQSRLVGATVESIEHLYKDRMIVLTCKKRLSHTQAEYLYLFARLWNNQANIILYDNNNTIIDALYRRPQANIMPKKPMIAITPPTQTEKHIHTTVRQWNRDDNSTHPFNDYIAQHYRKLHQQTYLEKKETHLLSIVQKALPYLKKTLSAIQEQIEYHSQFDISLFIGNEILAHLHNIAPQQEWLYITHPQTKESITVHLDTSLSPAQNAEKYFQKYKKSNKKLETLKEKHIDLEQNYNNIQKARQLLLQIQQYQEIIAIQEHPDTLPLNIEATLHEVAKIVKHSMFAHKLDSHYLLDSGSREYQKKAQQHSSNTQSPVAKQHKHIGIHIHTEKYTFFIGRNAKENDTLLRHIARGNDIWMHVRGTSGAFVFIRALNKQAIPLNRLETAAQLACLFSKCVHGNTIDLHYTQVKYLRRIPKKIGLVSIQRDNGFTIVFNRTIAKAMLAQP